MQCLHDERDIVIDVQEGSRICTNCGVVVESCMLYEEYTPTATPDLPITRAPSPAMHRALDVLGTYVHAMRANESVKRTATTLLTDVHALEPKLLRLPKLAPTVAGCLYHAFRVCGVDRSESEMLANCAELMSKELAVATKTLRRLLSTRPYGADLTRAISADKLIPRYLDVLAHPPSLIDPSQKRRIRARADRAYGTFAESTRSCQSLCIAAILAALGNVSNALRTEICHRCGTSVAPVISASQESS